MITKQLNFCCNRATILESFYNEIQKHPVQIVTKQIIWQMTNIIKELSEQSPYETGDEFMSFPDSACENYFTR